MEFKKKKGVKILLKTQKEKLDFKVYVDNFRDATLKQFVIQKY